MKKKKKETKMRKKEEEVEEEEGEQLEEGITALQPETLDVTALASEH